MPTNSSSAKSPRSPPSSKCSPKSENNCYLEENNANYLSGSVPVHLWEEEDDGDKDGATAHTSSQFDDQEGPQQQQRQQQQQQSSSDRKYSIQELVQTLGATGGSTRQLDAELERRVLDFRLAQQKRRQKHGEQQHWGIFGMYAHLTNVRTDLEWVEDAAWRRHHHAPYLSWSDFEDAQRKGGQNRPWFTYGLITACTIMMVVEFGLNDWKVEPLKVNPLIGPSADALIRAGARDTTKIVEDGQWFRIFTPLVLHAGLIHYVINMGALWFIGVVIEQTHGIINTFLLFLIPGVGGNILSAIFLPQYISVGASGGIFGLIGGCIADITLNWQILFIKTGEGDDHTKRRNFQAIFWLVLEVIINTVLGLTPYIDNFCHLGGIIYGLCCGWSTIEPLSVNVFGLGFANLNKARHLFVRFFGLIVSVVAIMVTTAWLASSDVAHNPCSNCRYISCVPFPFFQTDKWWYCDDCDLVTAELYKIGPYYSRIDLTCPNQQVETIDLSAQFVTDRDTLRHELPSYCRSHCADKFQ